MSCRIVRGDARIKKLKLSTVAERAVPQRSSEDHLMSVEKEAFERGYLEGERIGKEMGEKMMETALKRYENSIAQVAEKHKQVIQSMEVETVRLALEISKKIVQRELALDSDLVAALAVVALKRVSGHHSITLHVSRPDFENVRAAVANVNPAVAVNEDAALERGDFLIDTAQTHLDGRVASQLDAISRVLFDE